MRKREGGLTLAPTDLGNFLSCRHLSRRDLEVASGLCDRPVRSGPVIEALRAQGVAHEQAFLAHLQAQGLAVTRCVSDRDQTDADEAEAARQGLSRTFEAMRSGAEVIYQPMLADGFWSGRADVLRRVATPSALGAWSYEVYDTKLARETRAGTILQLCVYSYLVEQLQGVRPAWMHAVVPGSGFVPQRYRSADFAAYFRLLTGLLGDFIAQPPETYPEPVPHCDLCVWWQACDRRRRGDDHLGYVAGITKGQIAVLKALGVARLETLAGQADLGRPHKGSLEALLRTRDQARMQWRGRELGQPLHELRQPLDAQHGLALLPAPTPDDIFLDFEGNHFADQGVQEYLTGYLLHEPGQGERYIAHWATTRAEERAAFEAFIDQAMAVRARNPNAHIYHFAPYEPAALKRLMGRYATRQQALDQLLRSEAFVDLHRVVRRALIASVERYSLKDLEAFYGYERRQDLRTAALCRRLLEQAIDAGDGAAAAREQMAVVEAYNREDCESTRRLRDWLEQLRDQAVADGATCERPSSAQAEAAPEISALEQELQALREALLQGVPDEPDARSDAQQAQFLLAHMMEFHRREEKATWWEYFRLLALEETDFIDERRAVAGLAFCAEVEPGRAPVHRYGFPDQELDARVRDDAYAPGVGKVGRIVAVDNLERTIDVKKRRDTATAHPTGLVLHSRVPADVLQQSLMRLGAFVIAQGLRPSAPYRTAVALLLRRPSALADPRGTLQHDGEQPLAAACRLVHQLDGHVLAIQGPPGTGKTFTAAHMICELVQAGRRVGVTAVSHKVIHNLMEGAMQQAQARGLDLRAAYKKDGEYEGAWALEYIDDYGALRDGLDHGDYPLVGGTAWCWSREQFEQSVDVLFVDEAGQMSLSNVLAVAPAGRSLVLLGDPQQLEQPLQSSHPEGSAVSALAHLLAGAETMPPDRGLFLDTTYRLHPDIARFTSEIYYEGRLTARPELARQAILSAAAESRCAGAGLRFVALEHQGNGARAPEEAELIGDIVEELLNGGRWRDKEGAEHGLTPEDILIVAPYNLQVGALRARLPALRERVGTVDRFQGQEAPVVIYSLTSSSPDDAPRGMSFLYDPHRFNVATSRAMALCILVGQPALFAPECKTPTQMRMANAFCRYLELCA